MAASDYGVLLTTAADKAEAQALARLLIERRLAACVQLLPIESFYRWEGETRHEAEALLLAKTKTALFDEAVAAIKSAHSYRTPEIVAMPFAAGLAEYFAWLEAETK